MASTFSKVLLTIDRPMLPPLSLRRPASHLKCAQFRKVGLFTGRHACCVQAARYRQLQLIKQPKDVRKIEALQARFICSETPFTVITSEG